MKMILQSARILVALTTLTGIAYPLVVTGISRAAFSAAAEGSIIHANGKAVGSELLAQKTETARYFHPRPSAGDFATMASAASNYGPTSAKLARDIADRREKLGLGAPSELLTTSGSGLDPHLSPDGAKYQARQVAKERKLSVDHVNALIDQLSEGRQFGVFGEPRVNILKLNLALDELK